MTAEENKTKQEPRGAGSGEHANRTRGRQPSDKAQENVDKNLDFAEGKSADDYAPENYEPGTEELSKDGDPAAGKLDYRTANGFDPNNFIPMRDRRAYLLDQAAKNEAVNDELNRIQVEQNARVQLASNLINDPDYQRDTSFESAKAQLEMHDPDKVKERQAALDKQREAAAKNAGAKPKDQTTADFKSGQAAG